MRTRRERLLRVYSRLHARYGLVRCPLRHGSAFQLLVAVILSAQCRDERVNMTTPELFRIYPDARSMALADPSEVEKLIHACGLSRGKSAHIVSCARMLTEEFGGRVPDTMEELLRLPGVGRKSANVVLGDAFGLPGFPVDTHVRRVLGRLGLTDSEDPAVIESEVNAMTPPEIRTNFSHLLILHGREVCRAARPACADCQFNKDCPSA